MKTPLQNTITRARRAAIERLRSVSPSAAFDVDMLLAHLLNVTRAHLLAHGDDSLTHDQRATFDAWVERATSGEPVAYILGWRGFYDLELIVTPDVLIPRPETELLLEQALAWCKDRPQVTAVDVGTGSGALAVTFARHVQNARVYATDISPAALHVAAANAQAQNVDVTFFEGDLLMPLIERGIQVELVMANLPYIASDEVPTLAVSRYEPLLALDGGTDGLDLVRRLLAQIPSVCLPGALILLEIGAGQGAATQALARDILSPRAVDVLNDYAGLDRIVRISL